MTLFLFGVAMVGGALNAVAGGGSFLALPALLFAGVAPVVANATTTMALWPGSLASAIAYRGHFATSRSRLATLLATSIAGGLLGGFLLVRTSDTSFLRLLPWLMLAAAVTFTFGGALQQRLRRRRGAAVYGASGVVHDRAGIPLLALLIQLLIATYGGYFGGGAGIMMLAMLSLAGLTDIHEMNGLKALLAVAINGVALAAFVAYGVVDWSRGAVMIAGAIVGGYAGASIARRIDPGKVRAFVIAVGWIMTFYFFLR